MTTLQLQTKINAGKAKNKLNYSDAEIFAYRKLVDTTKNMSIDLKKFFGVKSIIHISIKNQIFFKSYMDNSDYIVTEVNGDSISVVDIKFPELGAKVLSKREFCRYFFID